MTARSAGRSAPARCRAPSCSIRCCARSPISPGTFRKGTLTMVGNVLQGLPAVDDSAGVPMFAPALMVPRVFSFEICDFLIQFYETQGARRFRLPVRHRRQDRHAVRLAAQAAQRRRGRRTRGARTHPRPDRAAAGRSDRAIFSVQGDAHGSLCRRLLRQRGWRPLPPSSRQHQRRRPAPALRALDQPQQGFRRRRPDISRIRPQGLPAVGRRRAGVFMRRAASGDAGDQRPALRFPGVHVRRGRRQQTRSQQRKAARRRTPI